MQKTLKSCCPPESGVDFRLERLTRPGNSLSFVDSWGNSFSILLRTLCSCGFPNSARASPPGPCAVAFSRGRRAEAPESHTARLGPTRGRYILEKEGIKGVSVLSPPLAAQKVYLYLNKKHEPIIPDITSTLITMKADGTYSRIFDSTIGPYVSEQEAQRLLR